MYKFQSLHVTKYTLHVKYLDINWSYLLYDRIFVNY